MLDELRKSYEISASYIHNWKTMNITDLANGYIQNEQNTIVRDYYIGALIARYWYKIGMLWNQSNRTVSHETCYDWVIWGITYALNQRKWLDPSNKLYNDINAVDKTINRCIISSRMQYYYNSNLDKNKVNYNTASLDSLCDDFGDSVSSIFENSVDDKYENNYIENITCKNLVQTLFDNNRFIDGFILDTICFKDSSKLENIYREFSDKKVVKYLSHIDKDLYISEINKMYDIEDIDLLIAEVNKLSDMTNIQLHKAINKTLLLLRSDKELITSLCF